MANGKESWLKQDGMTQMWLAVSVGYTAGYLRPSTQWLEFTKYTKSYSPLRLPTIQDKDKQQHKCQVPYVQESCGERPSCFEWMWCISAEQVQGKTWRSPQSSILQPALWYGLNRKCAILALAWNTKSRVQEWLSQRLLGCASVCREDGSKSKLDRCKSCG